MIIPETKEEYLELAEHIAKANDITPAQLKETIDNCHDFAFLADEVRKCADNPDIEYLKDKYMLIFLRHAERKCFFDWRVALKSAIAGDIAGSLNEFQPVRISEELFDRRAYYTDDTVLNIATMAAAFDETVHPNFLKYYMKFAKQYPDAGYGGAFNKWFRKKYKLFEKPKGYHSCANGCLMRIGAIPFFYHPYEDAIDIAISSCMVTHNHAAAVKAVIIYATCICMAMTGSSRKEIRDYVKEYYPVNEYNTFTRISYRFGDTFEESCELNKNLPGDAQLYAENMICFIVDAATSGVESCKECFEKILAAGGDTDTAGAVAGPLCYALFKEDEFSDDILTDYGVDELLEFGKLKKVFYWWKPSED